MLPTVRGRGAAIIVSIFISENLDQTPAPCVFLLVLAHLEQETEKDNAEKGEGKKEGRGRER